jgi:hypothetical protein
MTATPGANSDFPEEFNVGNDWSAIFTIPK